MDKGKHFVKQQQHKIIAAKAFFIFPLCSQVITGYNFAEIMQRTNATFCLGPLILFRVHEQKKTHFGNPKIANFFLQKFYSGPPLLTTD